MMTPGRNPKKGSSPGPSRRIGSRATSVEETIERVRTINKKSTAESRERSRTTRAKDIESAASSLDPVIEDVSDTGLLRRTQTLTTIRQQARRSSDYDEDQLNYHTEDLLAEIERSVSSKVVNVSMTGEAKQAQESQNDEPDEEEDETIERQALNVLKDIRELLFKNTKILEGLRSDNKAMQTRLLALESKHQTKALAASSVYAPLDPTGPKGHASVNQSTTPSSPGTSSGRPQVDF